MSPLIMIQDENLVFWNLLLTLLVAGFVFVNVRRTLREGARRGPGRAGNSNAVATAAVKTLLFFVFYGIGVVGLLGEDKISWAGFVDALTGIRCEEEYASTGKLCDKAAVLVSSLAWSALNLGMSALLANVLIGLYVFACYFYFNVQTGIAAIILIFASGYLGDGAHNFFAAFALIAVGVAVGIYLYKIKTWFLNQMRQGFAQYRGVPLVGGLEFYMICLPYFAFSMALSALFLGGGMFNAAAQVVLAHVLAYSTLYPLYRAGRDIGFDYDPW